MGYTVPKTFLKKYKIDNARLYVAAQNLWTITGYSGYNREGGDRPYRPRFNNGEGGGYRSNNGGGGGYRPRYNNDRSQGGYRPRPRTGDYDPNAKYSVKKQIEYKEQFVDPNEPIRLNKFLANAGVLPFRFWHPVNFLFPMRIFLWLSPNIVLWFGREVSLHLPLALACHLARSCKESWLPLPLESLCTPFSHRAHCRWA